MKKIFENPNLEFFDITDEIPNTIFAYWKGYLYALYPKAETLDNAKLLAQQLINIYCKKVHRSKC